MVAMISPPTKRLRSLATAAAHQAAIGTAALLQYAMEGPELRSAFEDDTIEKLADALKIALEIEAETVPLDSEQGQLLAAVACYFDGWAG